jgi:CspA family cold shock protein
MTYDPARPVCEVQATPGGFVVTLRVSSAVPSLAVLDDAKEYFAGIGCDIIAPRVCEQMQLREAVKEHGRVKWFDDARGYGFLLTESGDLFVHHRGIAGDSNTYRTLVKGQYVRFLRRFGVATEEAYAVETIS